MTAASKRRGSKTWAAKRFQSIRNIETEAAIVLVEMRDPESPMDGMEASRQILALQRMADLHASRLELEGDDKDD